MASKEMVVRKASVVPTSATTPADVSSSLYIGDLDPSTVAFTVVGTYTSTMKIEVSLDGVNWFQAGGDIAGTGAVASRDEMATTSTARASAAWARLRCSAFTSITAVAFVAAGMPASL
jgi:hypothetical protein